MRKYETLKNNPEVHEEIVRELERLVQINFNNVFPPGSNFRKSCEEFISRERALEQISLLAETVPGGLKDKKLLEIGSGCGPFVHWAAAEHGADAWGIDAGRDEFSANIALTNLYFGYCGVSPRVCQAEGEALPFSDNTFDVIYSSNVLEHVRDTRLVLQETVRALKPGGLGYFIVPNYGSWWEGHYGIFWLPHLPKYFARFYLSLWGRSPEYISTINLITVGFLKRCLAPFENKIEVVSWGMDVWEKRMRTLQFSEWAELGRLKCALQAVRRLGILPIIIWIGKRLQWQTPIILVFRKK
jgi:ubiquinone/menaquinone biosynthesis C-methylase UbiE